MDKSTIYLSGKIFDAHIIGSCQPDRMLQAGYSFLITKGKNNVGSFDMVASTIAIAGWKRNSKYLTDGESLKRLFLQILPSIDVPIDYQTTGETDSLYFKIILGANKTEFDPKSKTLYINSENSPEDLVEKLVYGDDITDKKVQDKLLRHLMSSLREDSSKTTPVAELKASFFIDEKTFEFNLGHLWNTKKVTIHGINSGGVDSREVTISTIGMEYLEHGQMPAPTYMHIGDNVGGDKINANTFGPNSQNIIKSINVTIDFSLFSKLESEIKEKYTDEDKEELLQQVQEAQELAKKDTPENKTKILKIMGFIMSRGSQIATIGSFALQIYQFFHSGITPDFTSLAKK